MNLNKVFLIGNLTKNPELKALPSGVNIAKFTIATNRSWKDKDGQKKEEVQFINCVAFGKQAELISQYMSKGSQMYVEGRISTSTYEKDGEKKYFTEVIVENFQFGRKPDGVGVSDEEAEKKFKEMSKPEIPGTDIDYPEDDINPEDIPFN